MKNKKIILALSLIAALGATMMVGGSLAWFTDTDEATNNFTVGSVEIKQHEVFDATKAQLIPVISNDMPEDDPNFIEKKVSVENIGRNPAYVQTFVAVPAELDKTGVLHVRNNATGATGNGWVAVDGNPATSEIDPWAGSVMVNAEACNVYKYRNENPLAAPTGSIVSETEAVILGVYIDQSADINVVRNIADATKIDHAYFVMNKTEIAGYDMANMTLNVYVASQAVQSQGFEADTVNNKTAAQVALDSAFPAHPWA